MQKKRHERPFRTQVGGACTHYPLSELIFLLIFQLIWQYNLRSCHGLGRLADELRTEQEHGLAADKANKMMASQCTEMQSRLADVEAMALRHGKKIIAKLEERCRALEDELSK